MRSIGANPGAAATGGTWRGAGEEQQAGRHPEEAQAMVLRFGLTSVIGNDGRLRRALFPAAAMLAFAAFACGPWSGAFANGPIKIGLLLTYVGPTSIFARYEDKGARLLVEQTNKNGGIGGRQIELVNYDNESKPDRAGTLYCRLAH